MKETILVTGGAGYIGSHTCKALASIGFLPVTYDDLSTGHAYAVKWGPLVQGDLNDRAKLSEVFATHQPKAVLHFAASAIVVESMGDPGKYFRNNVGSTITLLETMRDHQVRNLVFSSTCATYGNPQFIPITEEHPQCPINPYGRSKLMIEQMISDFEMAHGLKSINLRYFNAAGADLDTEIGENHTPETHLIPAIIHTALGIRPEIVVYGTDFDTKDGSAIRDYIHVQDLADAHVRALQRLFSNQKTESFNLGTGSGYTVLEIIEAVQKYCHQPINVKIEVKIEKRRAGEPGILTADYTKARQLLGWEPRADLSQIIDSAWKWHKLLYENGPRLRAAVVRATSNKFFVAEKEK